MDKPSDVCVRIRTCGPTMGNDSGEIARGRKADTKTHMRTFHKHPTQRTEGITDALNIYV